MKPLAVYCASPPEIFSHVSSNSSVSIGTLLFLEKKKKKDFGLKLFHMILTRPYTSLSSLYQGSVCRGTQRRMRQEKLFWYSRNETERLMCTVTKQEINQWIPYFCFATNPKLILFVFLAKFNLLLASWLETGNEIHYFVQNLQTLQFSDPNAPITGRVSIVLFLYPAPSPFK